MYFTFIRVYVLLPNKLILEILRTFHMCPVRNQYVSRTELSILIYIILFANTILKKLSFLEKVQSSECKVYDYSGVCSKTSQSFGFDANDAYGCAKSCPVRNLK